MLLIELSNFLLDRFAGHQVGKQMLDTAITDFFTAQYGGTQSGSSARRILEQRAKELTLTLNERKFKEKI